MEFKLSNYAAEIQSVATANKCSPEQAVDLFVVNLTVMHNHHKGADQLNYHLLGQQWNNLRNKEKVAQKVAAKQQVAKARRATRISNE